MSIIQFKDYVKSVREGEIDCAIEDGDKWRRLAYECVMSENKAHNWLITSKMKTDKSEHVNELTCSYCLHQITMQDLRTHRYRLEE
jgi:hypothetical protein